jgi:type I restriction enzyme R subunit
MDKLSLSERDICTRYITPALIEAGWKNRFFEEVFTDGRIIVRGQLASRVTDQKAKGGPRRADYVLYAKPNVPIAVIEAKRNKYPIGHGIQQALAYAEMLDVPFAFSSNGDGFHFHDRTGLIQPCEQTLSLEQFPTLEYLLPLYYQWKGLATASAQQLIAQPYHTVANRKPRYYQRIAINRTLEAIAKGQQRIMLVMATGTGKTYTAFQIIWRLWKSQTKQRILFLADRNILVDQTKQQDFSPFGDAMHKIENREAKKNYSIYLALYQAVTGKEEDKQIFKQFPRDFFDLIVIDECHRGSAAEDSSWRAILEYFSTATHIGLTATPKEVKATELESGQRVIKDPEFNYKYFGEPIYTYSLKQGIEDGFLAPYKVIRIESTIDQAGYTPPQGKTDIHGKVLEQRTYTTPDYDRNLVIKKRTEFVAKRIWEYLSKTDPMAKTIVFCDDQDHAERMRQALVKLIPEAAHNRRYVMRITGDDKEGKAELENFIDVSTEYPVIATTSKLMTTGVDAKTCKLIVLDQTINSMTEFKQIVGRGTRLREDKHKLFFTIMDFKGATRLFSDSEFDGEPVGIYEPKANESVIEEEQIASTSGTGEEQGGYQVKGEVVDGTIDKPKPPPRPREKYELDDVEVDLATELTQYLDANGKLIATEFRGFLKQQLQQELTTSFGSLQSFLQRWSEAERKQAIVDELKARGIELAHLYEAVPNSETLDLFDLLAHIAFDQKPLTRQERANHVKKRNYFGQYGGEVRQVLEALLDQYSTNGVLTIENPEVLEMPPFDQLGSKSQIRRHIFGGVARYQQAIADLERVLYEAS